MEKSRKKKNKKIRPDQVLDKGPLRLSRYGNKVIVQNAISPQNHKIFLSELANRFTETVNNIDEQIQEIINLISNYDPFDLLSYAYGSFGAKALGKEIESDWSNDDSTFVYALEYIQSIIAASPPLGGPYKMLDEQSFAELRHNIGNVYQKVLLEYQIVSTAKRKIEFSGPVFDEEQEELFVICQMYWAGVRHPTYWVHHKPILTALLEPHNEAMREIFGISHVDIIEEIEKINNNLCFGLVNAGKKINQIKNETENLSLKKGLPELDYPSSIRSLVEETGRAAELDDALACFFGKDLYDVGKSSIFPQLLLDHLSFGCGEETEFLKPGMHRGWPLRVLPIRTRPFIRIDNSYYCFDATWLATTLYRTIQRILSRTIDGYSDTWNAKQKKISEELPLSILEKMLPGATSFASACYQWPSTKSKDKNWCEVDGLILFDDILIVLEIKAGAFTYTSPACDFDSYRRSIESLIQKPFQQAKRFMEYACSSESIGLFSEKDRQEITRIKPRNFRKIFLIGISMDNFTHIAAGLKAGEFNSPYHGQLPFIHFSLSDLLVYSDLFGSSHTFLHYLEMRSKAMQNKAFSLTDEMDHLGLYFEHNNYSQTAIELLGTEINHLQWGSFSGEIDRYYHSKLFPGQESQLPSQKIPKRLEEIIQTLERNKVPQGSEASSAILNLDGEARNSLNQGIESIVQILFETQKLKALTLVAEFSLSVYCSMRVLFWTPEEIRKHIKTSILVERTGFKLGIHLIFNDTKNIEKVELFKISQGDFTPEEIQLLSTFAKALASKRLQNSKNAHKSNKIGRNEPCPCGSGKKYKKWCS